jgi:hypothetical protein
MRADTLRGQVGGGWALEIESFLGPVKWHRADKQVQFGAQKTPQRAPSLYMYSTVVHQANSSTVVDKKHICSSLPFCTLCSLNM